MKAVFNLEGSLETEHSLPFALQENSNESAESVGYFSKPATTKLMNIRAESNALLVAEADQNEIKGMSKTTLTTPKLSQIEIPHHYMVSAFQPIQTTLRITHTTDSEFVKSLTEEKYLPLEKFLTMSSFMKQKEPVQPRPAFNRVKADCHKKEVTLQALDYKTSKKETLDRIVEATVLQVVDRNSGF